MVVLSGEGVTSSFPSSSSYSSATPQWKYDVFLSIRADDTHIDFADDLHKSLKYKGIKAFRDDEGHKRGKPISELAKVIEESRCAVILFSENYADSKWSLDELAKIVECREKRGMIVLPVFYHIDPSDVRNQTGIYAKAFAEELPRKQKIGSMEKEQTWRAALTKVGNLGGWHLQGNRYESELIWEITKFFLLKRYLPLDVSSENEDVSAHGDNQMWLHLNKRVKIGSDGHWIGKIFVSNKEIAKGSNGTIVFEGSHEGREVAVKRLLKTHNDVADNEIQNLIASERHPNIIQYYGREDDEYFVHISLERCTCSLDDLIHIYSDHSQKPVFSANQATRYMNEYKAHLESVKNVMPNLNLWKANGHPSPQLLNLMRNVVFGLVHLHKSRIIHKDLKPQNVLIMKGESLCAMLSDMGISNCLPEDTSSLGLHDIGCGSSGWQAPEQLPQRCQTHAVRRTRAVDVFSLGCVLFFCITGGRHPFGDRIERDNNIWKNQKDLSLLEPIPEAKDLISCLLEPDPVSRPKALEVLHHPLFWSSETRLSFLRDISDRLEREDRRNSSDLLNALESIAPVAFGTKWNEKMDHEFINDIRRTRKQPYVFDSSQDLLRAIRNKFNHYEKLAENLKELVGPNPEGLDGYFASRFPRFFIEVYKVVSRYCREEERFQKYFKDNVD